MFHLWPMPICWASECVCVCVLVRVSCKAFTLKKEERRKKSNQSGSSLGLVTKVIQRFYQWAKVPVAMETLMNEKGLSNRGDGVNEELPHRSDTICDGGSCLETEFWIASSSSLPSSSVLSLLQLLSLLELSHLSFSSALPFCLLLGWSRYVVIQDFILFCIFFVFYPQ